MNNIETLEGMIRDESSTINELLNQLGKVTKDFTNLLNEIDTLKSINNNQELTIKEKECSISMLRSMISGIIDNY